MDLFAGILFVIVIYLLWAILKQRKLYRSLYELFIQQSLMINDSDKNKVRDDFLKFVSDSREWAFNYIEDVQKNLFEIVENIKPSVEKVNAKKRPSTEEKNLVNAYKQLQTLLPEQENNESLKK